ncbi:hydroxyacid dehydrogenase [Ruicaihuangia caeni]|uniref:hydroxyacid dehydrogenase n=1 Tax=Ruicaihuangia caeni TaxID=3042517 RepID=UPI00338D4986
MSDARQAAAAASGPLGGTDAGARPVVVVLEPIHPSGIEVLERSCEVRQLANPQDPARGEALATADALVVRSTKVGAELMDLGPNLRVIGRHGAGTDNIDLAAAEARGIRVVNTPRSNTDSVAEYVITVALMLLKRIPEVEQRLRSGAFSPEHGSLPGQVSRGGLSGREAAGTRLGLVGAGAIGRAVAVRAQALGMKVSAFDAFMDAETIAGFGITPVAELDDLLASADIVSLHIPGGGENTALLNAERIARMQPGSVLINAARGDLVEAHALSDALTSGHLAGAAVDVFDPEPPAVDHVLFSAPNLVLTPHAAAMTHEALERMAQDVAANVVEALGR